MESVKYLREARVGGIDLSHMVISPPNRLLVNISNLAFSYSKHLEDMIVVEDDVYLDEMALKEVLSIFKNALVRIRYNKPLLEVKCTKNRFITPKLVEGLNLFFNEHKNTLETMIALMETR
jgi:hypothetical protein